MSQEKLDVSKMAGFELFQFRDKGNGKKVLVINKGVEISVNGRPIQIDEKYRTLFLNAADESIDFAVEKGWKTLEQAEEAKQRNHEKGTKYIVRGKF